MPGAFHGINLASNALRMFQRALDTTGNNIANVNTNGYSRQRVDFSEADPTTFFSQGWKTLGNGVNINSVTRIRDMYLDARARSSASDLSKYDTIASGLKEVENAFNEPGDNGISAALDKFFTSWSGLGSSPTDPALQAQVRNAGQTVTDRIRNAYNQLSALQTSTTKGITSTVTRINELGQTIAGLNGKIREFSLTQGSPNELLDARDNALQELSSLIDVKTETFTDGTTAVYAAGFTLVDSAGNRTFPSTPGALPGTMTDGNITYTVRSGELAGLFQTQSNTSAQMANLDTLANTLRNQFNTLHRTGNNNAGIDFFNEGAVPPDLTAQNGAATFDLSAAVKTSASNIVTSATGLPGDGGLALALGNLRDTYTGMPGGKTFESYYRANVDQVAQETSYYNNAVSTEKSVGAQIKSQQQAVSGVSLDDEMADMLRYQRSYQAAAKALTIADQVTQDLIGMLNR